MSCLPEPPDRFNPALHCPGFETEAECAAEDLLRGQRALRTAPTLGRRSQAHALDLAGRLLASAEGGEPALTPASKSYMRDYERVPIVGALWEAVEAHPERDWRFVTIIPHGWRMTTRELIATTGRQLTSSLRSQINRHRVGNARGFMFVGIHGEWEPESRTWKMHGHGVACSEMLPALRSLRRTPWLARTAEIRHPLEAPLLGDPGPALTYCLQSWWPSRRNGPVGDGDHDGRSRLRHRIPEPEHTRQLLWFDAQAPTSLYLMMGGRFTRSGLLIS